MSVVCQWFLLSVSAGITAALLGYYAAYHYGGHLKKAILIFTVLSQVAIAALLLKKCELNMSSIKSIITLLILMVAAYSDIKTREVADYFSVMLFLTAFIGKSVSEVPGMLISAILICVPSIIVCMAYKGNGIGGADIKIIAACGSVLGAQLGWIGMTVGLVLAILLQRAYQIITKNTTEGFPLVPYLAVGFSLVQIIGG